MKTVHQDRQKDKGLPKSDLRMVFFRVPHAVHLQLRRLVVDIEERTGEKVTMQSLMERAIVEFVEKNKGK